MKSSVQHESFEGDVSQN